VVKVTTKDSYLVTTGTEPALHVPHQICQVVKPPFQGFYPLSVHGAVRLIEGDIRLQGLDQVQLSPPSLLQLMNSEQDLGVVVLEALDHRLVTFQPVFIKANPTSQRGQILVNPTKDSSGISYTLTPLSFQGISLWVQLVENLIVLQQLDLPVPGSP